MDPNHHNTEESSRGLFNFQSQQRASELRRPSNSAPLAPSQSHQSSWSQFSIPTNADSLSSGFTYDTRLRQLGVSNEEWRQFTNEVVNEAKLSLEDDKVAWGAGIATGTAGSALLLLLGPVAGYYTGKAVHKRTVVEKVKERLLEDGQMSRVLRKWNGGAWAQKGFHTWIELPDQACSSKSNSEAKRFRILVIPGVSHPPQSPMSRPSSSAESQQTSVPQKRPVPPPPVQPYATPMQQSQTQSTTISNEPKSEYPPPPIQSPVSQMNTPAQQPQGQPIHSSIAQKFDYPPPSPTAPSFHQPPLVPHRNSLVEPPPYQQPSVPHRDSDIPPPLFYHSGGHSNYAGQIQKPAAENFNYPPPPPLPAKVPPMNNYSNNQIYEMPSNEPSTVFELPDNQPGIAELPSEAVNYYEMDGGNVPQVRR